MTSQPQGDKPESARDWPEDFPHENGNYNNRCQTCGKLFTGHKQRVTCKLCANQPATPSADEESATPEIKDDFHGNNEHLCRSIKALIELSDREALIPNRLGGHARELLAACYQRLPLLQSELASLQSARERETLIPTALVSGRMLSNEAPSNEEMQIIAALRAALAERDREIEKKQKLIETACRDWADDDTRMKEMVKRLIPSADVEGDSHGVPSILDCGDMLCNEIVSIRSQLLALQAHVERLREALRSITKHQTRMGGSFDQWYKEINEIAFAALSSQPDLPLIEEVREVLTTANEALNTCKDHCYSDGTLHHQTYNSHKIGDAHLRLRQLLTRLNPRKD